MVNSQTLELSVDLSLESLRALKVLRSLLCLLLIVKRKEIASSLFFEGMQPIAYRLSLYVLIKILNLYSVYVKQTKILMTEQYTHYTSTDKYRINESS